MYISEVKHLENPYTALLTAGFAAGLLGFALARRAKIGSETATAIITAAVTAFTVKDPLFGQELLNGIIGCSITIPIILRTKNPRISYIPAAIGTYILAKTASVITKTVFQPKVTSTSGNIEKITLLILTSIATATFILKLTALQAQTPTITLDEMLEKFRKAVAIDKEGLKVGLAIIISAGIAILAKNAITL